MGLPGIAILLSPFIIELFGDYWLIKKGKRDISIWWRTIMVVVFSALCLGVPGDYLKNVIVALMPYTFFDPCLNLLRGKKLTYSGKTKEYDLFLSMFPPWVVLVGRLVFVVVLLVIYNWL